MYFKVGKDCSIVRHLEEKNSSSKNCSLKASPLLGPLLLRVKPQVLNLCNPFPHSLSYRQEMCKLEDSWAEHIKMPSNTLTSCLSAARESATFSLGWVKKNTFVSKNTSAPFSQLFNSLDTIILISPVKRDPTPSFQHGDRSASTVHLDPMEAIVHDTMRSWNTSPPSPQELMW